MYGVMMECLMEEEQIAGDHLGMTHFMLTAAVSWLIMRPVQAITVISCQPSLRHNLGSVTLYMRYLKADTYYHHSLEPMFQS